MQDIVKCYICGTIFDRDKSDNCPCCDWFFEGFEESENANEYDEINHTTIAQAKENLAKGLNKWGEPLPKK